MSQSIVFSYVLDIESFNLLFVNYYLPPRLEYENPIFVNGTLV